MSIEDPPPIKDDEEKEPIDLTQLTEPLQIDIRRPEEVDEFKLQSTEVPTYSRAWARVVRPFTFFIFWLLAAVILFPFLFVFITDSEIRDHAYDWAKTILAPIVGFASAAIGYYYGTRQSGPSADSSGSEEALPDENE